MSSVSSGENMVISASRSNPSSRVSDARALLSPTMTAAAPRSCAFMILRAKSHEPRSTSAMWYGFAGAGGRRVSGGRGVQARDTRASEGGVGRETLTLTVAEDAEAGEPGSSVEYGTMKPDKGSEVGPLKRGGKAAGRWGTVRLAECS